MVNERLEEVELVERINTWLNELTEENYEEETIELDWDEVEIIRKWLEKANKYDVIYATLDKGGVIKQ